MTNDELEELTSLTNKELSEVGKDRDTILKMLGADGIERKGKTSYTRAVEVYPELCTDSYTKDVIKETKKSIVNSAKYGKLLVDGTYTFVLPDVYAFMEWLFLGIDQPQGLLKDGEVSCRFFEDGEEVDVLRSPHLNFAHCINKNVRNEMTEAWYKSNSTYTSAHSLYSLEVMCDWDGDIVLITRDKTMIKVAKRIREKYQIVPLYYELKKASDCILTPESLYKGMIDAYSNGNIGTPSNNITKVWNSGYVGERELKAISYLTLWNNVVIDSAKTLWYPDKSDEMEEFLKGYTGNKLPYFFKYINGKEKTEEQVESKNDSVVNRIASKIINKRITFSKDCGKLDYRKLQTIPDRRVSSALYKRIVEVFTKCKRMRAYNDKKVDFVKTNYIREQMNRVWEDETLIVDVLIDYYYRQKKNSSKRPLWNVYGDIIVANLECNIDPREKICNCCGKRYIPASNRQKVCPECKNAEDNRKRRETRARKKREDMEKKAC